MIDMAQADRTLYQRDAKPKPSLCFVQALRIAALRLGFDHFIDVPDDQVAALKETARKLQRAAEPVHLP